MNDAAGIGVLTTDRELRIRSWNPWLAAASGRTEGEVIGHPLQELTGGPTSVWYHDIFEEVLGTGTPRVLAPSFHRYLIPCAPREASTHFDRMQQRVTVAPLHHDEVIAGLIVTIEDVTWRLDAERELAVELQGRPASMAAVSGVGASDWKVRRAAVDALRQTASRDDVEHLIQTLRREHQDINVLSSALQVLVSADVDVAPALIQLLTDVDPNLRMHAALALGQLRSHEAAGALTARLTDDDHNVRFHAIEALGKLGAPDAIEPLAGIAGSGDFFLAFAAIDALGRTDDARVAPRLTALLGDEGLRPAVIDTLAQLGDEDTVRPLMGLLNQGVAEVPAVAAALERIYCRYEEEYQAGAQIAEAVRSAATTAGLATLSAAVERRATPLRALVTVLGWIGPASLPALIGILDEADVQATLDAALVSIGRAAVDPLLEQLERGSREGRLVAASVLGRLGDPRAVEPLARSLAAADAELVASAAGSIAALGDPRALDALLPLFAHPRASVRQAAISGVNAIGSDATASRIRERLTDADPRVRECAIRVAGYFGFPDAEEAILEATADQHEEVRRAAIDQLPILQSRQAIAALVNALAHETPRNRAAAAHASSLVESAATEQPLLLALEDDDPWVRYFAAGSLGRRRVMDAADALSHAALHDTATHVRIAALHALAALDAAHLMGIAATLIREADPDLSAAALTALASAHGPRVDDLLEDAVRSSSIATRVPAAQAIAARPTPRSAELLGWAALVAEPPELRSVAIEGLRRLAQSSSAETTVAAVTTLLALSAEQSAHDEALAALVTLPEASIDAVASVLSSGSPALRLAAVETLARKRHRRASEALARALDDPSPAIRSAAVAAFGRLGTPRAAGLVAAMQDGDPDEGVRRRAEAVCQRHGWQRAGDRT